MYNYADGIFVKEFRNICEPSIFLGIIIDNFTIIIINLTSSQFKHEKNKNVNLMRKINFFPSGDSGMIDFNCNGGSGRLS